jgi:hydroxypyruvate isomerase
VIALHFAVNLSMLFGEYPMSERFRKASENGFKGVELLYPYEYSKEDLKNWLDESGVEMVLFNLHPGDVKKGEKGFAACPGRENDFRESVKLAIDYASALDCKRIHVLSGIVDGETPEACDETFRKNIAWGASVMNKYGITLQLEPLNTEDVPGYFLCSMKQAVNIISCLKMNNIGLQLDVYHLAKMENDIISPLVSLLPWTSHVQISDVPGRCEPGKGTLDFVAFFSELKKLNYKGWISCEYHPSIGTEESLGRIKKIMLAMR